MKRQIRRDSKVFITIDNTDFNRKVIASIVKKVRDQFTITKEPRGGFGLRVKPRGPMATRPSRSVMDHTMTSGKYLALSIIKYQRYVHRGVRYDKTPYVNYGMNNNAVTNKAVEDFAVNLLLSSGITTRQHYANCKRMQAF